MRILIDTNVLLDVLLNRAPWAADAAALWAACTDGRMTGYVCASSLTDIFYVARRMTDLNHARSAVRLCLTTFEVCTVDRSTLEAADRLSGSDFEDNLQIACAVLYQLDAIITRDPDDFEHASVAVMTPADALTSISN